MDSCMERETTLTGVNTPVGGAPGVTGSLGGAGTPGAAGRASIRSSLGSSASSPSCSRAVASQAGLLLRLAPAAAVGYWAR
jgi:hypothetical protein